MIHLDNDKTDIKKIEDIIADYNDGDIEMHLPSSVTKLDKPVLLYIISRLLAQ